MRTPRSGNGSFADLDRRLEHLSRTGEPVLQIEIHNELVCPGLRGGVNIVQNFVEGLIIPGRAMNSYREYGEAHVDVVQQIKGLLDAGLPTRSSRNCCPAWTNPRPSTSPT